MSAAPGLHPFLQLMKRYCVDYTNSHDTSWIPQIMRDDYVVHICQQKLLRSEGYRASVEKLFADAPGLGLTVHQMYCNGDRLAMRFTEHACWRRKGDALTSWRGFSTYAWDGSRLTVCWVEQDFRSRQRQMETGVPHVPGAPAIDPWMTPIVPEDSAALSAAKSWLQSFDLSAVKRVEIDDNAEDLSWRLEVIPERVEINDLFSVGRHAPFHLDITGPLLRDPGERAKLAVCGVVTVADDGSVARVQAVTDRMTLAARKRIP